MIHQNEIEKHVKKCKMTPMRSTAKKCSVLALAIGIGLVTQNNNYAIKSEPMKIEPNEKVIQSLVLNNFVRIQLTQKAQPATGTAVYSLYAYKTGVKEIEVLLSKKDFYKSVIGQGPLQWVMTKTDINQDGKEECFVSLSNGNTQGFVGLLGTTRSGLKTHLFKPCAQSSLQSDGLSLNYFDYDYGLTVSEVYNLSKKETLSLIKDQCLSLGIRPGISYDRFSQVFGQSAKKKYDTSEALKQAGLKRYSIQNNVGEFIFQGRVIEGESTDYYLKQMTIKTKELLGFGNIKLGDSATDIRQYVDELQRRGKPVLFSNFLLNETQIKTTENAVSGVVEVWKFKHSEGRITDIKVEME